MNPGAAINASEDLNVATKSEPDWLRPVGFGFAIAFASAPGQTFFVSLSAGAIRREFGLEHLEFSALYTAATVLSALLMLRLGGLADRPGFVRTTLWTLASMGVACMLMAGAVHVAVVGVALAVLRVSGQGMLGHLAMTGLGRCFTSMRGRALAIASLGYPCAEGLLPSAVAWGLASTSWRVVWLCSSAVLVGLVMPLVGILGRKRFDVPAERSSMPPTLHPGPPLAPGLANVTTRAKVLKDPRFYAALPAVLLPAFVLTGVFFHQVHLADTRGWSLTQLAQLYPGYAVASTLATMGAGWLVDRTSAWTLLSVSLTPLSCGLALLSTNDSLIGAAGFYVLAGVAAGCASILQGTVWPELYGTERLGEVRAVAVTGLVLSTAAAPVVIGAGLDAGVTMEVAMKVMLTVVLVANLSLVIGSWVSPFGRRLRSKYE